MLISYNWLKSYIPQIPPAEELAELITFHLCEIEGVEKLPSGDSIFDMKILPDRAHDLLSHQGIAREISSLLGIEFQLPVYKQPLNFLKTNLKINIEDSNTRRYMGRIVRGVKVGPSPAWMVTYLESVGQRSINNIVDATNIVLLDCGQPIHAFDLAKLDKEGIVVRNAKDGDSIELVGREKQTVKLKNTDMVITDGVNNLAIAGVKGGLSSGVTEGTQDILIEVANFDAVTGRKTARRLSLQTDASKRYENDLSPTLCDFAMKEITSLVFEMCEGASFEEVVDVYKNVPEVRKVIFSNDYISKMLGVIVPEKEIEKILKNYNYEYTKNRNTWEITVPPMRIDIQGAHDMIEEIGRVYGYDKVIPQIPKINKIYSDNPTWLKICEAKNRLVQDGYREVMTSVFADRGDLEIMASASDKSFLRTNIKDGLSKSYELNRLNAPLLNVNEVKIFEVGACFTKDGSAATKGFGEIKEVVNVCFADKKGITEMSLDKFVGDIILSESILEESSRQLINPNSFKMWSSYPFITRDIAVWVPEGTMPEVLIDIYKDFGTELLVGEPKLFDSFTKSGKTSFAYRLVFQAMDRTLTDEEINKIMSEITKKIVSMGFEVR